MPLDDEAKELNLYLQKARMDVYAAEKRLRELLQKELEVERNHEARMVLLEMLWNLGGVVPSDGEEQHATE